MRGAAAVFLLEFLTLIFSEDELMELRASDPLTRVSSDQTEPPGGRPLTFQETTPVAAQQATNNQPVNFSIHSKPRTLFWTEKVLKWENWKQHKQALDPNNTTLYED